jgi:glucose-6-phosphate 1-epimerase
MLVRLQRPEQMVVVPGKQKTSVEKACNWVATYISFNTHTLATNNNTPSTRARKTQSLEMQHGGLEFVELRHGDARATICVYGAHVTDFTVRGSKVLFLSQRALFEPPKAIRGGIPVIFPQFSGRGSLPSHGFARNKVWRVASRDGQRGVVLELEDTEETRKVFPPFRAVYSVSLSDKAELQLTFRVQAKESPLSFTCALHTYFAVGHISKTRVAGLKGVSFEDQLNGNSVQPEQSDQIVFDREVDRVYLSVPRKLTVIDGANKRTIQLHTTPSLPDAVVWNPWEAKALKMAADFGPTEFNDMVCVEVGAVAKPVQVRAGESWEGRHTIAVVEDGSKL